MTVDIERVGRVLEVPKQSDDCTRSTHRSEIPQGELDKVLTSEAQSIRQLDIGSRLECIVRIGILTCHKRALVEMNL